MKEVDQDTIGEAHRMVRLLGAILGKQTGIKDLWSGGTGGGERDSS